MTHPDFSGLASVSFNFILSRLVLKRRFPPPRRRGTRPRRYSSIRWWRVSVDERFALPKMKRVLPGCAFSRVTSFSAFSFTSLVLLQSAFFSVLEKTTLGILFMKSAMSPFWEGQYEAMPSYVTRPNKSISADRSCSRESCSSSSPQTDSCQSRSQLLGPSKKPSRVIRFHMTSCLTFGSPQSGRPKCRSFKYLSMMLLLKDPRGYCWAADLFLHFWEEAGEHL